MQFTAEARLTHDHAETLEWATRLGARYMGAERAEEYGKRNAVPEEATRPGEDHQGRRAGGNRRLTSVRWYPRRGGGGMLSGEDSRRDAVKAMMTSGQRELVAELERLDGGARFGRSAWQRPEGGGGQARLLENGDVFERAGVNYSASCTAKGCLEAGAAQHGRDADAVVLRGVVALGLAGLLTLLSSWAEIRWCTRC